MSFLQSWILFLFNEWLAIPLQILEAVTQLKIFILGEVMGLLFHCCIKCTEFYIFQSAA